MNNRIEVTTGNGKRISIPLDNFVIWENTGNNKVWFQSIEGNIDFYIKESYYEVQEKIKELIKENEK